ncbi:hypothetical protein F4780DRAFT_785693 [Xylariomycetidae sp. FL0641]|nr:hypothetical protein F4780DRAFT_785693 [Xylariomycetidae sp. FL0641]
MDRLSALKHHLHVDTRRSRDLARSLQKHACSFPGVRSPSSASSTTSSSSSFTTSSSSSSSDYSPPRRTCAFRSTASQQRRRRQSLIEECLPIPNDDDDDNDKAADEEEADGCFHHPSTAAEEDADADPYRGVPTSAIAGRGEALRPGLRVDARRRLRALQAALRGRAAEGARLARAYAAFRRLHARADDWDAARWAVFLRLEDDYFRHREETGALEEGVQCLFTQLLSFAGRHEGAGRHGGEEGEEVVEEDRARAWCDDRKPLTWGGRNYN